jgi:pimeloyl-ACP methyl ester carboxylesterase
MKRLLLLPGMDGTGDLFGPFAAEVSSWATTQIIRYPTQVRLSVDELVEQIELDDPVTAIAESFSGVVGIRLAAKHPALVRQLVLVGAFVTPPTGSGLWRLFGSLPFQRRPPRWAVRAFLAGSDASDELVGQIRSKRIHEHVGDVCFRRLVEARQQQVRRSDLAVQIEGAQAYAVRTGQLRLDVLKLPAPRSPERAPFASRN